MKKIRHTILREGMRNFLGSFFQRNGGGGHLDKRRVLLLQEFRAGNTSQRPELHEDMSSIAVDDVRDLDASYQVTNNVQ